jgi:hypothetical protein
MCYQEHVMSINKDQVEGRVEAATGAIKEATGKVQANLGDVKQEVQDSLK